MVVDVRQQRIWLSGGAAPVCFVVARPFELHLPVNLQVDSTYHPHRLAHLRQLADYRIASTPPLDCFTFHT